MDFWKQFFGNKHVSVSREYLQQVDRDLTGWEDIYHRLWPLLKEAHDKMDDHNARENNIPPFYQDEFYGCLWCNQHGYDGNGLKHKDDCILVKIRKELSL